MGRLTLEVTVMVWTILYPAQDTAKTFFVKASILCLRGVVLFKNALGIRDDVSLHEQPHNVCTMSHIL